MRRLQSQVEELEEQVRSVVPEVDLQTSEPKMRQALDVAFKTAASEATILLRGESGTGKGVLARAIHARSQRAAGPFVTVHCPSLSAELLESELFGHVQGAFTGAVRDTIGKVAVAEGGTLFLDEIGDLPLALQPKLLRLLQERCYERVGRHADASQQRPHPRRHQSRSGGRDGGRPVPRRPLLPLERDRGDPAAACASGPPTSCPWPNTCSASSPGRTARRSPGLPSRCAEMLAALSLARQHPRAAQRDRAGRHSGLRARWSSWATCPSQIGSPEPLARPRSRDAHAGTDGGRAYPPSPGFDGHHRGGGRQARHRPEHAVPKTEEIWDLKRSMGTLTHESHA